MKKHLITGLFAAGLMLGASSNLMANGTAAPVETPPAAPAAGVEITGNVTAVAGWQHDDKDAGVLAAGAPAAGGLGDGILGFGGNVADADHVRMVIDQVEIDLQKSFGENIRLRADIDFTDFADGGHRTANVAEIEQAYVTTNIAAGNGIEFLFGKFNAPVGVDVVDRHSNWLISYSYPFRYVTPTNVTGAKLYYAFSDLVDLHVAAVNDLNSNGFGDSAYPSGLFRLGFNWGEEGNASTLGISGGVGPEWDSGANAVASQNKHIDFFGDLDMMVALSDTINLSAEGVYRQSDKHPTAAATARNQKVIAGFVAVNYEASDVWDLTLRGQALWDVNPEGAGGGNSTLTGGTYSGMEGMMYGGSFGAGYAIADGAKMKLEYRFDFAKTAGTTNNADFHSVLAEFAYNF